MTTDRKVTETKVVPTEVATPARNNVGDFNEARPDQTPVIVERPRERSGERGSNQSGGIRVYNLGSTPKLVVPEAEEDGKTVRELVADGHLNSGEYFVNGIAATLDTVCMPGDAVVSTPAVRGG